MPFKVKEIERLLDTKFGFALKRKGKHIFYELCVEGLRTIRTHVSHGNKRDVGRPLEAMMARELGVRNQFFREMISCTKTREDYLRCLRENA